MIANRVSTIIPVFNRPRLLRRAVDSVLAQDHPETEIVIVDDGSADGGETLRAARAIEAQHRGKVIVLSQPNSGPGPARQHGLRAATGEFIQFLDSDDTLLPGKFTAQVQALREDTRAGISYGVVLDEDTRLPAHGTDIARRTIFPAVVRGRLWNTLSPLYRRSVCDAIGPWSALRILEDWDYECRAGLLGIELHHCAQPVGVWMNGGDAHAGLAWIDNPQAMLDRIEVYERVMRYAVQAGVQDNAPEMRQFARSLFWMAREAAVHGLPKQACRLFELARSHALGAGIDYTLFRATARALGWQRAARLANWVGRWR